MPRDGTAARKAIVDGALTLLRERGLPGFSVEGVAARADVAKGLVLYHYGSRAALVELCAGQVDRERAERLERAATGRPGIGGVDALWNELVKQHQDGTARAWLSLAAAGAVTSPADDDLAAQARRALLDGCAAALAAGGDPTTVREAYEALALALLRMDEA